MEGGLVNINNLIVRFVNYYGPQFFSELLLLSLELAILGLRLVVPVVRALEANAMSYVVSPEGAPIEGFQMKLVLHNESPLPQAQVTHALEGVQGNQPVNLFLC